MNKLFLKRIMAYIIDIIIVNMIVSVISVVIPYSDNYEKLNNELLNINNQFMSGEIDNSTYLSMVYDIEYDIKKETIPFSIISVVISLLYFIVLPFYNGGRTLGKMLYKIRIKKRDGASMSMNDYVVRAFINNSVFMALVDLLLIFVLNNSKIVVLTSVIMTYLNMIILLVSLVLIIFSKKRAGIHDIICSSEVVEG